MIDGNSFGDNDRQRIANTAHRRASRRVASLEVQLSRLKAHPDLDFAVLVEQCERLLAEIRSEMEKVGSLGEPPGAIGKGQ